MFIVQDAIPVRQREDGLIEKDTFDVSTARPVAEFVSGERRYVKPLSDQEKARSLYELMEKEKGRELPLEKKIDWALTSDKSQAKINAVANTLLTGGLYPVIEGLKSVADPTGDYSIMDRVTRGIFHPEDVKPLYKNLPGTKDLPKWAEITAGISETVLEYALGSKALAIGKTQLLARDIARRLEDGAEAFAKSYVGEAKTAEGLTTAKQASLMASIDQVKEGWKSAVLQKMSSVDVSTLKTGMQEFAENKSVVGMLINEVKNLTVKPVGLSGGGLVNVKVGQRVAFTESGKELVGTISKDLGKTVEIEMAGRTVVASLSQLSTPKDIEPVKPAKVVLEKNPQDFKTAEEYVASKGISAFHGTPDKIEKFEFGKKAENRGGSSFGYGINITEDVGHAKVYSGKDGNIYNVVIPKDELANFIIWETSVPKELSSSVPKIDFSKPIPFGGGATVEKIGNAWKLKSGEASFPLSQKDFDRMFGGQNTGEQIYRRLVASLGDEKSASEWLLSKGIKGISNSTERNAKNYTIFDPSIIQTKSQLTSEWQAAQGVTPPTEPPTKPTAVSPGPEEIPASGKGTKQIIRETTGQVKSGEKILNERQALRETLKAQVKAATRAERATREEIFDIQSNIIKTLDESGLELKDKAKFIKAIKNIQTQEQLKKSLPDIERRINRLLENQEIKKQLGLKRQQLAHSIIEKKFEKVDSLRTAMELPPIKDMRLEQVEAFEEELSKYQEGDVFLTKRQFETVDNTDLAGIKTLREAREALAKEAGVPVSELSKIKVSELDRMTYDVALAEKNPFYSLLVEEYHRNRIEADLLTREFEQELNDLTNKARASRKQEIADILVPTDKLVFEYLSNPSAELVGQMTPEELDLAFFLEAKFSDALEYLIKTEALKTGRENYITNIRRSALEAIKEDGLVAAFKEALDQYKQDEAVFNILDSVTGQILPLEKFFQFAMQRKGGIKPSQNVAKAASVYFRTLYTKQALDKFIPKMMIYVDSLTPTKLTPRGLEQDQSLRNFVKEWVNSKKGRKVKLFVKQGGVIDVVTTGLKAFTSVLDLGLNIPAGIAANVGESAASFVAIGGKQIGIGVARFATRQGKNIVKKYEGFVGRTVWDELLEPSRDLGDKFVTTLFGLFSSSSTRANKIGFLGSLTEEEFRSGEISSDRLLDIKMTLGRFRIQPGMKSVLENTTEGGIVTQYKTWALPILSTVVSDFKKIGEGIGKGTFAKKEAIELSRALMITLAALAVGSVYDDSKRDNSFSGQLIRKVKREALTIIGALDPEMWLGTPRLQKWLADLGTALKQLIILEKYKSMEEKYKNKMKGVEATKRLLIPRAIKQFDEDKKKRKIRG